MFTQARATFSKIYFIAVHDKHFQKKDCCIAKILSIQFHVWCTKCAGGGGVGDVRLKQKNCVLHKWKT